MLNGQRLVHHGPPSPALAIEGSRNSETRQGTVGKYARRARETVAYSRRATLAPRTPRIANIRVKKPRGDTQRSPDTRCRGANPPP